MRGMNNMNNDTKNQKTIEQLTKKLHLVANNPPHEDPFSRAGAQAWENWTEACRNYYVQLLKNNNTKTLGSHEPPRSAGFDATNPRSSAFVYTTSL
jgi:hypothetical protein